MVSKAGEEPELESQNQADNLNEIVLSLLQCRELNMIITSRVQLFIEAGTLLNLTIALKNFRVNKSD